MRAGIPVGLMGAILLSVATVAVVFVRAFGSQGQGWSDILAVNDVIIMPSWL